MDSYSKYDELSIRCPVLGGEVTYKYCKTFDRKGCPSIPVCFKGKIPGIENAVGKEE